MKRRQGFIANSSSSCFLIIRVDSLGDNKILLSPEVEKLLLDYGFKKVNCYYADQIPGELYTIPKPPTKARLKMLKKMKIKPIKRESNPNYNYGYDISCNQDDVIYFLLKNNIPFEANVHYGHYTVIYKKNSKEFLTVQNFGVQAAASNWRKSYKEVLKGIEGVEAITKTNVKKYLKSQEKWQKEYKQLLEDDNATLNLLTKK